MADEAAELAHILAGGCGGNGVSFKEGSHCVQGLEPEIVSHMSVPKRKGIEAVSFFEWCKGL